MRAIGESACLRGGQGGRAIGRESDRLNRCSSRVWVALARRPRSSAERSRFQPGSVPEPPLRVHGSKWWNQGTRAVIRRGRVWATQGVLEVVASSRLVVRILRAAMRSQTVHTTTTTIPSRVGIWFAEENPFVPIIQPCTK